MKGKGRRERGRERERHSVAHLVWPGPAPSVHPAVNHHPLSPLVTDQLRHTNHEQFHARAAPPPHCIPCCFCCCRFSRFFSFFFWFLVSGVSEEPWGRGRGRGRWEVGEEGGGGVGMYLSRGCWG